MTQALTENKCVSGHLLKNKDGSYNKTVLAVAISTIVALSLLFISGALFEAFGVSLASHTFGYLGFSAAAAPALFILNSSNSKTPTHTVSQETPFDKSRWNDQIYVLSRVNKNGLELGLAYNELRKDREVVLAAVRNSGLALCWASEQLKSDSEVVEAAIKKDPWALRFASEELQKKYSPSVINSNRS